MATKKSQRKIGALKRAEAYFIAHVGEIVNNGTLRKEIGEGSDSWTRRVRELRENLGYKIRTHLDRPDLKPGQYILEDLHRIPVVARSINKKLRALILERNGYTCLSCGIGAGETHEDGRPARLHIGHIVDVSHGGSNDPSNLRALCSLCNEGSSNVSPARQSRSQLLATLRRARPDEPACCFRMAKETPRKVSLSKNAQMSRVRSSDTKPERQVREVLTSLGVRYRLQRKDLPGTPDLYIPRLRLAVFVNGCFWHGHGCARAGHVRTNVDFWNKKIESNVLRDQVALRGLAALGIDVVSLWTCESAAFSSICKNIAKRYRRAS